MLLFALKHKNNSKLYLDEIKT